MCLRVWLMSVRQLWYALRSAVATADKVFSSWSHTILNASQVSPCPPAAKNPPSHSFPCRGFSFYFSFFPTFLSSSEHCLLCFQLSHPLCIPTSPPSYLFFSTSSISDNVVHAVTDLFRWKKLPMHKK